MERLNQLLFQYGPQMIGTKVNKKNEPGHWVTATGHNIEETTLLINDPDGGKVTTVADEYSNRWSHIRPFSGPEFVVTDNSGITIRFHSPGELVLTNPDGRRVGFDPISGTKFSEIPS